MSMINEIDLIDSTLAFIHLVITLLAPALLEPSFAS